MGNPGPGSCSLVGLSAVVDAGLAQRRAIEGDPVGIVNQPVEDGVGEGGLANDIVPGLHGELTGSRRTNLRSTVGCGRPRSAICSPTRNATTTSKPQGMRSIECNRL